MLEEKQFFVSHAMHLACYLKIELLRESAWTETNVAYLLPAIPRTVDLNSAFRTIMYPIPFHCDSQQYYFTAHITQQLRLKKVVLILHIRTEIVPFNARTVQF